MLDLITVLEARYRTQKAFIMSDETSFKPLASTASANSRGRSRPRPRAGVQRKTKAEREQFAKEEAERQEARAAEHEAATRGVRGGRAVNRGGRGGATPAQREGPVGGGGVFGGSSAVKAVTKTKYEGYAELLGYDTKSGGAEDSVQATAAPAEGEIAPTTQKKAGVRGKTSTAGKATASPAVAETIETTTDDEPEDKPKRDIERIWISSDEEDESIASTTRKGKQKAITQSQRASRAGLGLRPVRAPRTLQEEKDQDGHDAAAVWKKRTATSNKSDNEAQEISSDDRDGDGGGCGHRLRAIRQGTTLESRYAATSA